MFHRSPCHIMKSLLMLAAVWTFVSFSACAGAPQYESVCGAADETDCKDDSALFQSALRPAIRLEENMRSPVEWDPDLLERPCLLEWMKETQTSTEQVCSDDPRNNIKSDKGNYIQFTRREDRLMYNVWQNALQDCIIGESYVRDIVASFAERTSCFKTETELLDDESMYVPAKELVDGRIVVNGESSKVLCKGSSKTASQTQLHVQLDLFRNLVSQWDHNGDTKNRTSVCKDMLSAHVLSEYAFIGVLWSTRPAACNTTAAFYDQSLCKASEKYLLDFLSRDLFAQTGGGFKGRAAKGENERAERCKEKVLKGRKWYEVLSMDIGITEENTKCSVATEASVFPEPVVKGTNHYDQANNIIADAYRQCGAPLVAGISGTMPQYLASAAAGPTKQGYQFSKALSEKEVLTLMSMLELAGFHAMTGLTMGVNFYYKKMVVTPPFDSGAFEGPHDGIIRCHDHETHCCTNSTKVGGFYNHQVYLEMIQAWEQKVQELWPAGVSSF
mmetsp:Transcript_58322/g.151937  ORF Transcript_58322/g.151937 Transcript_58322/m.151937 type:complete len:502 (+) Transcript_58322:68-1573(+)